jgi:hypothetical protein
MPKDSVKYIPDKVNSLSDLIEEIQRKSAEATMIAKRTVNDVDYDFHNENFLKLIRLTIFPLMINPPKVKKLQLITYLYCALIVISTLYVKNSLILHGPITPSPYSFEGMIRYLFVVNHFIGIVQIYFLLIIG